MTSNFQLTCEEIYRMVSVRVRLQKSLLHLTSYNLAGYKNKKDYEVKKDLHDRKNTTGMDPAMFNKIASNTRGINNKYLITDSYIKVLSDELNLNTSNLLFGNINEVEIYAGYIFKLLITDLLNSSDTEVTNLLDMLFMDYVPYASKVAYRDVIDTEIKTWGQYTDEELNAFYNDISTNVVQMSQSNDSITNAFINVALYQLAVYKQLKFIDSEDDNTEEMDKEINVTTSLISLYSNRSWIPYFKNELIGRLFLQNKDEFIKIFYETFSSIKTFKKLPKIMNKFVHEKFIQLLKDNIGLDKDGNLDTQNFTDNSLGYRVQNIICTDIQELSSLIFNFEKSDDIDSSQNNPLLFKKDSVPQNSEVYNQYKKLLSSAEQYVKELTLLQHVIEREPYYNSEIHDAELHYTRSITSTWDEDYQQTLLKTSKDT